MIKVRYLLALSAIHLFGTFHPLSSVAHDSKLVIGGIFDSSGAGATWGEGERNGFELAVTDFRKDNPEVLLDYKIEDSGYSNQKAVSAFQKFTSVERIKFIVGPTWEPFQATLPLCEARQVICLSPSYSSQTFDQGSIKYSFSFWFNNDDYAQVIAQKINSTGLKKIALVAAISPYYDGLVDILKRELKMKPIAKERPGPEDRDFRGLISRIPKEVDGLVLFLLGDGGFQSFVRQWTEIRADRPDVYSDDAILYLSPKIDLSSLGFKVLYSAPDLSNLSASVFNQQYKGKFGSEPPSPSAAIAYDATRVLLDCIAQNSGDVELVRGCISTLANYAGQSGTLSFNHEQRIKTRKMELRELVKIEDL